MRKTSLLKTIAFVLLAGAFLFGAAPSIAQVAVELPDLTVRAGTSDTIPITVEDVIDEDLADEDVISYEFTISFDESVVDIDGVSVDGTLSEGGTVLVNTATPGEITVSFASATELSGHGTLLLLNASFEAEGESQLTFDAFMFNEGDPAVATTNGSVTVVSRAIFIGDDITGFAGQEGVLIPVLIDELTADDDILAFQFDINFDPSILEITGAETDGSLSEGFSVVTNEVAGGTVRLAAAGTSPVVGTGTLIYLRANLLAGGTSDLSLTNVVFNEGTPVIATIAGQIVVGEGEAFEATLASYNEVDPTEFDLVLLGAAPTGDVDARVTDGTLVLSGSFSGLSSVYSASHIHIGGPGVSGGVVIPLTATVDADGLGGTFEEADNTYSPEESLLDALREGGLYVNVHTAEFPAGEIRGQLLDAPNAAPAAVALTEPANGADIRLEGDPDEIVTLDWPESTDPNGDEVVYVLQLSTDPGFSIFEHSETLTESSYEICFECLNFFLADLGAGFDDEVTLYVRVSSQDGSLRAIGPASAVNLTRGFVPNHVANLAGMNEVPPVQSTGSGTVFVASTGTDIVVSGSFSGLIAPYTASHIHLAIPGEDGPVVVPLVAELDDDARGGLFRPGDNSFSYADLTYPEGVDADVFAGMVFFEQTYVNVHSTAHPAGELRGQVKALGNVAPEATSIDSPAGGTNVDVEGDRNDVAYTATWSDPEIFDNVVFIYQIATSANFSNVIFSEMTTSTFVEVSVREALEILEENAGTDAGASVTVFHRVITSDGSLWTAGPSSSITLTRTQPGQNVANENPDSLPTDFALKGNYPNPFNPSTSIRFDLPETADVRIVVVDMLGREVLALPVQTFSAGANRSVQIDASWLASGTYLYRVTAKGAGRMMNETGTMTLMK